MLTLDQPGLVLPAIVDDVTRREFIVGGTALATLLVVGCGSDDEAPTGAGSTRTIEHAFGTTEVPADIKRLVVIDQAVTLEHVVALGFQPAGAPIEGRPPPQVLALLDPSVEDTGTSMPPNLERIAAVKPDLIIGWKLFMEDTYEKLSELVPTVGTTRDGFADWKSDLRFVADVLGRSDKAEELIADYDERVASIRKKIVDHRGKTCAVISVLNDLVRTDGDKAFPAPILADLGLNVGPATIDGGELNTISGQTSFGFEHLPALDAVDGWIFFQQWIDDPANDALKAAALWQGIDAVRNGRVIEVSAEVWLQGSVVSANLVLDDIERTLLPRG